MSEIPLNHWEIAFLLPIGPPSARLPNMAGVATITVSNLTVPRLGKVLLATSELGICGLALPQFNDHDLNLHQWSDVGYQINSGSHRFLEQASEELNRYVHQKLTRFTVPIDVRFLSSFTQKVLNILKDLPYGKCLTYGELATRSGKPNAARAVGGAVGRNPVPVIIPCHRVIANNGIGGFGLGLPCKKILLAIEKIFVENEAPK